MISAQQAQDQAAEWLVRQEEAEWGEGDQSAFEDWLQASEGNKAAYWRLKHTWHGAGRLRALATIAPMRRSVLARHGELFRRAAAVLLLAAVGAASIFAWNRDAAVAPEEVAQMRFETPVGGRKEIRLSDGSVIDLNTASVLRVALSDTERRVWLDRGEAYFQVAHIPARPFVVVSADHAVTVLGTRFAVRREQARTTVSVISGRVRLAPSTAVADGGRLAVLTGGDIAVASGRSTLVTTHSVREVEDALSWRTGTLTFDDAPLAEAAAQFNRYNRQQLVLADDEVAAMRIGGAFPSSDPVAFARLLRDAYGLKVQIGDDIVKVSR